MSENESNEKKVRLQKVESSDVKQTIPSNLKEARIDSSDVRAVQKGIVSAASVGQVRTGIDQMVSAASVQQVRSQIEQPKPQQKEKPQNQQ
jgi:predicted amino acid dehydrogenase